jgi:hypothetical protein
LNLHLYKLGALAESDFGAPAVPGCTK